MKPTRLLLLQPIVLFLAIAMVAQPHIYKNQAKDTTSDQNIPAAGQAAAVQSPTTTAVVDVVSVQNPTPTPIIPTVVPTPDYSNIVLAEPVPDFDTFVASLQSDEPGQVRGVYVPGALALHVEQQPPQRSMYVTSRLGYASQYSRAAEHDVIGLLAHNTHSGILFYRLELGQEVSILYGSGSNRSYVVDSITDFQKLQPHNPRSDYVELATGIQYTTNEMFNKFYTGGDRVTFQTCLEYEGDFNWGVRFVIALPLDEEAFLRAE